MSNTLVSNVSDIKEPVTKSKECWDGDTLSHLGFSNIQVGGTDRDVDHENQDQGVALVTKVWKKQGVRGTNPLKTKRKVKTSFKECDMSDVQSVKAEETPAFVKNCMKNFNSAVALASATSKSAKTTIEKPEDNRYTLDRWKLYIDNCASKISQGSSLVEFEI